VAKKPVQGGPTPGDGGPTLSRSLTRLDLVCLGTLVLRFTHPRLPRPFRCPAGKAVAATGAVVCLALMLSMPAGSWLRLGLWLLAGLTVYFLYAWRSGRLGAAAGE